MNACQPSRRELLCAALASSASLLAVGRLEAAPTAPAPRERLLMDFGWKFFQGNADDPARDLGFGSDQGDFAKTGAFDFAKAKFDDSKWRALNLPHDWAVELPFVHDEKLQGHGYKPLGRNYPETSVGWYRRGFDIPQGDLGRRIMLEIDGALRDTLVFVNGYFVGRNDNGYAPFAFDISDYLNYGGRNYLVVRVDASFGDGWFYEGAGLYRHVWLNKTDRLHLGDWESTVRSEVGDGSATLNLGTMVRNENREAGSCRVRWQILDPSGTTVAQAETAPQNLAANGTADFSAVATLPAPQLWSPETPVLYTALVTLESNGETRDSEHVTFGVRSIRFDADKGFFLNGKPVKIKGTCNHHDHAGVGAAVPDALQYYRVGVLKQMESNAVRTSHNMPTPEWVHACERMGMMMLCETRLMNSSPEGVAQLETMIKRYRNSPAIILWSMGNEEWVMQTEDQGERILADMVARSHELDPTRLCTAAVNGVYDKGVAKALDVQGFNYRLDLPDPYHKAHPSQACIGTETASTVATRGIYTTDKLRNWVSAYDLNAPPWAYTAEVWWKFYAARDWLAGGFAWTGFDYRGEPTPYGWPSINSQFGIVDMCGFPKDDFFYYQAWWGDKPVLHLLPHWNWEEREGEPIAVWVHSNLDEVELFLNGVSQGRQKVQPLTHLEWQVKYQPGIIEARGYRKGALVLTEKRETTGPIAALHLSADRGTINADGEDLAIIRVEAQDAQGRMVPTANRLVHFKVSGEGALIGVGNGDPNCQESDKEPQRSLFNGLAQVILQAGKTPETILLEATMGDGPNRVTAQLPVTTRKTALRPQLA